MGKQEIIDIMRINKPEIVARYGVQHLGLFGSYVRGQQRKRSDIDILVSFSRDIDLFDFIDLREYLEVKLHGKVDLVMESALKPAIGKRILAEVEYV
jgi:predicted nucleotidyltransferase